MTGGAGFIGESLINMLLETGHEPIIFDNFSRFEYDKIQHLKYKVKIINGDVSHLSDLLDGVPKCDRVVHLAGNSRVDVSKEAHFSTFENNVRGTLNVLEYCRVYDSKLIFASSWMVYDPIKAAEKKPLTEDAKTGPITPYGVSKLMGEQYCHLFFSSYNVPSIRLRFSNVYGPKDKNRLIPFLISRAKTGDDIHIFGAEQTLNFIYVNDVVNAIYSAILFDLDSETDTFNIGTEKSINLTALAKDIISMSDSKSRLIVDPPRPYDFSFYSPETEHAKKKLKFKASIDWKKGLSECIEYY